VLVDAYGKVIGRPGLDLKRRELCTVAATAVLGTADQLHSHLRGALNTGASAEEIEAMLALLEPDLDAEHRQLVREQWTDVKSRSWRDVFIDRAVVHVVGGAGGAGASSFRAGGTGR